MAVISFLPQFIIPAGSGLLLHFVCLVLGAIAILLAFRVAEEVLRIAVITGGAAAVILGLAWVPSDELLLLETLAVGAYGLRWQSR
jgi:hypothetical protein